MLILKLLSLEPTPTAGGSPSESRPSRAIRSGPSRGRSLSSLHRLTREGWIRSSWADTENGRRARAMTP